MIAKVFPPWFATFCQSIEPFQCDTSTPCSQLEDACGEDGETPGIAPSEARSAANGEPALAHAGTAAPSKPSASRSRTRRRRDTAAKPLTKPGRFGRGYANRTGATRPRIGVW